MKVYFSQRYRHLSDFLYFLVFFFFFLFSLPLRTCLYMDLIVQYAQACVYNSLVFCPVFLHSFTSHEKGQFILADRMRLFRLTVWPTTAAVREAAQEKILFTHSLQPTLLRRIIMHYTNRLSSYMIHEQVAHTARLFLRWGWSRITLS